MLKSIGFHVWLVVGSVGSGITITNSAAATANARGRNGHDRKSNRRFSLVFLISHNGLTEGGDRGNDERI